MLQGYHRTILPNGLRIVSAPRHGAESVSVGVWINAGGRYEKARVSGISHFLEHLLFKGTKTRSARQIKEMVEGTGGALNAFTDEEFTCVLAKVLPSRLETAVEVLTDMVLHPALEPSQMEKERQVVMEEIRMYQDLPMQFVHDLLNTLLWPNHPLGRILSGTEKSVKRIERSDIRAYHQRHYVPRNIVVAACGKLSHRSLVEAVRALWARQPAGHPQKAARVHQRAHKPRLKVERRKTEQTHFSIGFHAFPQNHPQIHALNLLNVILGGNMSSRLFQRVREDRGLCYEIGSDVKRYRDTGLFSVSAGVEHRHLVRSLQVILKELSRLRREKVTPKEFEQALEYSVGSILFALEDTMEQMHWMGECEMLLGRVQPVEELLGHLGRVRREDLIPVARTILTPRHLSMAVIGPVEPAVSDRISRILEGLP